MSEAELAEIFIDTQDMRGESPVGQLESADSVRSDTAACVRQSISSDVEHQYHSAGLKTPATAHSDSIDYDRLHRLIDEFFSLLEGENND